MHRQNALHVEISSVFLTGGVLMSPSSPLRSAPFSGECNPLKGPQTSSEDNNSGKNPH